MAKMKYNESTKTYLVRQLKLYNEKKLQPHEETQFFQDLVDTGMAWQLGSEFSQVANHLISTGVLTAPESGFVGQNPTLNEQLTRSTKLH